MMAQKTITFERTRDRYTQIPNGYRLLISEPREVGARVSPDNPTRVATHLVDIVEAKTLEELNGWIAEQLFPVDTIIVPYSAS